ncbi:sugar ABC transporter substrate-binding protein [Arthrobacter sp. MSA 4-2]|uniref:ABC transporter substrate-binding protein n=1 Tax=Arthrobacter sp. MSA 4-2 TaxID=2794349 RepID=UPI0018E6E08A|nr:sugar ABC transporter substrate-binding protein [Arthrobacter sp. MSA 4-2]MBJ2121888.1 sugar ABC transporter substrate-binding protein [Arthrobacter sp. MSA 4-2]
MTISRRQILGGAGFLAAAAALGGCAGFSGGQNKDNKDGGEQTLTFTTWGSPAEEEGFRRGIEAFKAANAGADVKLNLVPYEQIFQNIDAQLQAGTAPDLFRVDYGTIGAYSSQDQLLDLSGYFDTGASEEFLPAMWQAIQFDGKPYGVPHQTDTSAVVYRRDLFEQAGITNVPDSLDSAWTWDEFRDVAEKLRGSLADDLYPFVYNWQLGGSTRWLSWLFQAGGRLLNEDLTASAIESDAGRKALAFTQSFFTDKLVPPSSSVKSSTYADGAFSAGTTAMAFVGNFVLPSLDEAITDFEWGATYLPRDERGACDLGGNALVATKNARNPDLAAEFLRFMTQPDQMSDFCARAMELPTLNSLVDARLDYQTRPDIAGIFVEQATTLEPEDVKQLTSPAMAAINPKLRDELEAAFTQGQPVDETLENIAAAVDEAVG